MAARVRSTARATAPSLACRKIVVPVTSMAHSAYGALAADVQYSAERSLLMRGGGGPLPPLWQGLDAGVIEKAFSELEAHCQDAMRAGRRPAGGRTIGAHRRSAIPPPDQRPYDRDAGTAGDADAALKALVDRFEETYEQTYGKGSAFREAGIELTNVRVEAFGQARRPELNFRAPSDAAEGLAPQDFRARRPALDGYGRLSVARTAGRFHVNGPAIIEHPETSVFVAARQISAARRRPQHHHSELRETREHDSTSRKRRRSIRSPSRSIRTSCRRSPRNKPSR